MSPESHLAPCSDYSPSQKGLSLEELVSYVQQHFTVADTKNIGEEQINRMLSLVIDRLPIVGKEFSRTPIQFGLLANTHKLYYSFYLCNIWLGGMIYDAIMLTSPLPGFGCAQEFALPHELGRAAHARLTRNIKIIPESFMEFFWDIFYQYPESIEEVAELFADFFCLCGIHRNPTGRRKPIICFMT